jgi:hypothetical protein
LKILCLSESLNPNANRILRWVSIRHGIPLSILVMVMGETSANFESSVLLMRSDSRTDFNLLLIIAQSKALGITSKESWLLLKTLRVQSVS